MFKVINLSGQSISLIVIRDGQPEAEFLGTEEKNLTCFTEEVTPELANLEKLGIVRFKEVPDVE